MSKNKTFKNYFKYQRTKFLKITLKGMSLNVEFYRHVGHITMAGGIRTK